MALSTMDNSMGLELRNDLALTLTPAVERRQILKALIAAHEAEIDTLNDTISGEMVRNGVEKIDVAGCGLSFMVTNRESLDKMRLVELGVSTEILKAATKTTSSTRLDVRQKKAKG